MTTPFPPINSDDLNAYIDGTAAAELRARIDADVAGTASMKQELDELRATSMLLGSLPEFTPRRSFTLGAEHARVAPAPTPGKIVQFLPIIRALSVAAMLVFMVVGGALFFDINGGNENNTQTTLSEQNEIMSNIGVTESHGDASEGAEDASDQAAPAASDSSHEADETNGSSLTERGEAASEGDAPMGDLTELEGTPGSGESDSEDQVALVPDADSPTTSAFATADDGDHSSWIWTSVVLGILAAALAGLWYVLVQVGRQSDTRDS